MIDALKTFLLKVYFKSWFFLEEQDKLGNTLRNEHFAIVCKRLVMLKTLHSNVH